MPIKSWPTGTWLQKRRAEVLKQQIMEAEERAAEGQTIKQQFTLPDGSLLPWTEQRAWQREWLKREFETQVQQTRVRPKPRLSAIK
jgi:hypothetical protein